MSAFISMTSPTGVALLTDGAVNSGRVLIEDRCKALGGVAITMRGQAEFGFEVAERYCEFAKQVGPAGAIAGRVRHCRW
jgi:hypothetical protein